ncbi:cyclase family protein [Candidatus Bipolaricaulota bacterium]|nr:cyclase family protein [Candidatus Bipolaricaulota bacterium]
MENHFKSKLLSKEFDQLVDLTYSVSPSSSVWPGDRGPEFTQLSELPHDDVNLSRLSMNLHTETHVDAPSHFIKGGATIDELPLTNFFGEAVVYLPDDKLRGQTIELEEVKKSGITLNQDEVFILNSGLGDLKGDDRYYKDFPTPSVNLVNWLLDHGIKCYGTDCPSIDPLSSESHENHELLLSGGIPIVENLANLDQLNQAEEILFFSLPLELKGLEASPCRATAIISS